MGSNIIHLTLLPPNLRGYNTVMWHPFWGQFNIKMSHQHRNSHLEYKTVSWQSNVHNGNPYTRCLYIESAPSFSVDTFYPMSNTVAFFIYTLQITFAQFNNKMPLNTWECSCWSGDCFSSMMEIPTMPRPGRHKIIATHSGNSSSTQYKQYIAYPWLLSKRSDHFETSHKAWWTYHYAVSVMPCLDNQHVYAILSLRQFAILMQRHSVRTEKLRLIFIQFSLDIHHPIAPLWTEHH